MINFSHDRLIHYALVLAGLTVGGAVKEGCAWVSKIVWKTVKHKVEMTTKELQEFHEWKKARVKPAA